MPPWQKTSKVLRSGGTGHRGRSGRRGVGRSHVRVSSGRRGPATGGLRLSAPGKARNSPPRRWPRPEGADHARPFGCHHRTSCLRSSGRGGPGLPSTREARACLAPALSSRRNGCRLRPASTGTCGGTRWTSASRRCARPPSGSWPRPRLLQLRTLEDRGRHRPGAARRSRGM